MGLGRLMVPIVPQKAVAEAPKIGHYRTSELLRCMDGRVMDRKVVGFFSGVAAMVLAVTSPTIAGCSVVKCMCCCSVV